VIYCNGKAKTKQTNKGENTMSNKMAVKIKTDKVISALEKALTARDKKFADSKKADAEYETAMKKWNDDLKKLAKSPKVIITDVSTYHRWSSNTKSTREISVTMTVPTALFPAEPKNKDSYNEHAYAREVDEINNALRLLRMTDQEYVNASTMKSVSQYL
jgi:hypothetical protein